MCVFRLRSVCALLLSLSLSSVFMFCAKKPGQDAAPPAAAVASDNVLADARDGKKYKTVKIGEQVWMAENLNYQADGSFCYENSADSCNKYGRLYDWETAKKACPAGWKLPSNDDWNKLVSTAGGEETAGKKLKSTSGWDGNGNGTDELGFSALPGGRNAFGDGYFFNDGGEDGYWWGVADGGSNGVYRFIRSQTDSVTGTNDEEDMYSVRCLKQ
jgi:uncharacterized protein (TIGR02145 family)